MIRSVRARCQSMCLLRASIPEFCSVDGISCAAADSVAKEVADLHSPPCAVSGLSGLGSSPSLYGRTRDIYCFSIGGAAFPAGSQPGWRTSAALAQVDRFSLAGGLSGSPASGEPANCLVRDPESIVKRPRRSSKRVSRCPPVKGELTGWGVRGRPWPLEMTQIAATVVHSGRGKAISTVGMSPYHHAGEVERGGRHFRRTAQPVEKYGGALGWASLG